MIVATLLAFVVVVSPTSATQDGATGPTIDPSSIQSPRLRALVGRLTPEDSATRTEPVWRELSGKLPLVETDPDSALRLVTFLWRGDATTRTVDLEGGAPTLGCGGKPLARVRGTDIWLRSERLPRDAQFSYGFRVNAEGAAPLSYDEIGQRERLTPRRTDSLNVLRHPLDGSIARLGTSSRQPPFVAQTPLGRVHEATISSTRVAGQRQLWIYTPRGYDDSSSPYRLMVVLDGRIGANAMQMPAALDRLLRDSLVPPTLIVFVGGPPDPMQRAENFMANDAFVAFLADELVPWVSGRFRVSSLPAARVVAGVSLGGFAALYAASKRPDVFGAVVSLSGAVWYHEGWRRGQTAPWTKTGILTGELARDETKPLKIFLAAGTLDNHCPASYLAENRRLADVLVARRYSMEYVEFEGGHTIENWMKVMPQAMRFVLSR